MNFKLFFCTMLLFLVSDIVQIQAQITTLDSVEGLYRELVTFQNKQLIEDINQKNLGFELAPNHFIDLTPTEFQHLYGSKIQDAQDQPEIPHLGAILSTSTVINVDWRSKGKVSTVSNQGRTCNSCYAFAAIADIQTSYLLANQRVKLSPQQIIDCSGPQGNHGCTYGFYGYAFDYVIQNPLSLETDYPYQGLVQSCRTSSLSQGYAIKSYEKFNGNDCNYLERTLQLRPVVVSLDGVNFYWQFYSNGVLTFCGSQNTLNHGVQVVGMQNNPDGTSWWIVKNSWGSQWGEDGYIRLDRTKNEGNLCKICSYVYYSTL